ncbi:hypothetical protein [Devosia sp. FKR38]|uniref:hypothetical protein n=1 Tax=Devosia sp. FKR38 TaxID=2562312 RepID=UPI0010C04737|nr:hypothetical protein [Devosia sp. FKR38]
MVLLAFGLGAMLFKRTAALWWFAIPLALSNALLVLALAIGNAQPHIGVVIALATLALELFLVGYALVKARAAWLAGLFLGLAVLSVALRQLLLSLFVLSGAAI